jgi:hypothetical protein
MRHDEPHEVHCGSDGRDQHRWELDPASSEDYRDRARGASQEGSRFLRWVHDHDAALSQFIPRADAGSAAASRRRPR